MDKKHNTKLGLDVVWLYNRGYTFLAASRETGYSMQHIARVLRGERIGSTDFYAKLRKLPKKKPITGRYIPEMVR